ncbi:ATP-dependent DNA helicase pif1 [Gigaspora margarita]|uniref:ATP-dependent DNA helicase pif1 n=1 Tax=Gigaspora margarita TaxID=4874 RepID=A0A8H4AJY3_GIGMA|nr:ATP-dependent DNA helicase pif1 [Gigaspora margarita]
MCQAKIKIQHLILYEHPIYHDNKLPENAIIWISKNIKQNFRKIEIYKWLCEEGQINPTIHSYNQVYYWVSKFSTQQYLRNASNQLLSSLNFLKQNELVDERFKVLLYIKNDFVRVLGFLTPFNNYIEKADINEIFVDSTYKTNQQKFELFAVLVNYGGHGVPFAYMYVDTFAASKGLIQGPKNIIHS